MLTINYHASFRKDYKKIVKRGYNVALLEEVIELLINEKSLPAKYKDHNLHGNYEGFRECHIQTDWLLVYRIENDTLTLILSRTGTHSDLF